MAKAIVYSPSEYGLENVAILNNHLPPKGLPGVDLTVVTTQPISFDSLQEGDLAVVVGDLVCPRKPGKLLDVGNPEFIVIELIRSRYKDLTLVYVSRAICRGDQDRARKRYHAYIASPGSLSSLQDVLAGFIE